MTDVRNPPSGWRQRVRRGLPFPPGIGADRFEIRVEEPLALPRAVYHLNLTTLEVFVERSDGKFDAPGWLELSVAVRRAISERARRAPGSRSRSR